MARDLIYEIGCEDLPPMQIAGALSDMEEAFREKAAELRISHGQVQGYATPRRLALLVSDVAEKQEDLEETRVGPPASIAFDDDGNPTRAAEGFMRGLGIESVEELIRVTQEKKKGKPAEYVAAVVRESGVETNTLLPDLLDDLPRAIHWPKSMRWGYEPRPFARPVHWLLARFGEERIACSLGSIESGDTTRGHRFHTAGELHIGSPSQYVGLLEEERVLVDIERRRDRVLQVAREAAASVGGNLLDDPDLLDEIVQLVEWPVAIVGSFDNEYLELPSEVLVTSMRKHQRYFSVVDENGAAMPHFVTIANTEIRDKNVVAVGNERVLRARLEDARFFYRTDQKKTLDEHAASLERVTYVDGLGSVREKVSRIVTVAGWLAQQLRPDDIEFQAAARRAAGLCKADLATGMVYEFPDLQGIMGGYYARNMGESEAVALGVSEHYSPRGAHDDVPESEVGAVVSIADRIDSIASLFSLGRIPTGAADPFALRRAAIGLIRIAREHDLRFSLTELIDVACAAVHESAVHEDGKSAGHKTPREDAQGLRAHVLDFVHTRLRGLAQDDNATEVVDAVLALGSELEDIPATFARIEALDAIRPTEDFEPIAVAFKRVGGILGDTPLDGDVEPQKFEEAEEKELHGALESARGTVSEQLGNRQFTDAMATLVSLRKTIDRFFDEVHVNTDDEELRDNRHRLLRDVLHLYTQFADVRRL